MGYLDLPGGRTRQAWRGAGICVPPWLDKGTDQLSTFALKSELGYGWLVSVAATTKPITTKLLTCPLL